MVVSLDTKSVSVNSSPCGILSEESLNAPLNTNPIVLRPANNKSDKKPVGVSRQRWDQNVP